MKQSGFGIASLILGIVGLVFSCFIVGIIPAFLGLIFAIIALCQKNTKNGMAIAGLICSIIGIVFSAIIILLGIAGSGNTSQTVSTNKKQEEVRSSSAQTESTMISPGYSFDANGVTVTINDFNLDFTDYDDNYGLYAPSTGKKYICIEVTFTNNAKTDRYVSSIDFQCYADASICDEKYGLDSDSFIGTSLSSGRKTSGRIYYEVPEDAQSIELEYETDFWTDHKEIMKLQ